MKTKLIILAVLVVVGIVLTGQLGSVVEVVNERVVEVEKTVEVNVLENRMREALEEAKASTTAKAQEAYDKVVEAETKRIEDAVKAKYIAEIEATISSPDYWRGSGKDTIKKLIRKYFPENYQTAYAVAMAESRLNPYALNSQDSHRGCMGSYGIFQIGCLHEKDPNVLYDIEYNIKRARQIYEAEGWRPWGAYTSLAYQKYMP